MLPFEPTDYVPHRLHTGERAWPQTNCYVDLWIEALHAQGLDPVAALAFTVALDFEGDQFTFFKFPPQDLRALYGLAVHELAIYRGLERHVLEQLKRGRMVLAELDGFYLPDTAGTSYRRAHVKTTVGIAALDLDARRMDYFHNAGFYTLDGEAFEGAFRLTDQFCKQPDLLPPYVEFVKSEAPPLRSRALVETSLALLATHLARRPAHNPITQYRVVFADHAALLEAGTMDYFHLYAFNTLRQLGANFELLASYLDWLGLQGVVGLQDQAKAADAISTGAKSLQFQLARAVRRGRFDDVATGLETLAEDYDAAVGGLARRFAIAG